MHEQLSTLVKESSILTLQSVWGEDVQAKAVGGWTSLKHPLLGLFVLS